jgi:hypothetical protein
MVSMIKILAMKKPKARYGRGLNEVQMKQVRMMGFFFIR